MSAFGSGTNENTFLIDGTNFTARAAARRDPSRASTSFRRCRFSRVGASAEFGNMQGAVVNVVTRQGGDRFLYDASYYGQTAALTSQPVLLAVSPALASRRAATSASRIATSRRISAARSCAIGCGSLRDTSTCATTTVSREPIPAFPRTYEQDKIFGKLTWRLAPGLQLLQSFHDEFWVNPELPTFVKPFEATQRRHASVPAMTFGHLTHTLSSNTVWDVRVGRFVYTRDDDPSTGNLTMPSRFDRVTGVSSGAPQSFGELMLIRTTTKATLNHYRPGLLGADHQWRIGGQLEKGEHQLSTIIPTGIRYVDNGGQPFQAISSAPSIAGGVFITAAGFVSDAITLGRSADHQRRTALRSQPRDQSGSAGARCARTRNRTTWSAGWARCIHGTSGRRAWASP